jgi:hypothetical protein
MSGGRPSGDVQFIQPVTEATWKAMPWAAQRRFLDNINAVIRALNADPRTAAIVEERRELAAIRAEAVEARRAVVAAYAEREAINEQIRVARAERDNDMIRAQAAEDLLAENTLAAARRRLAQATNEANPKLTGGHRRLRAAS